MRHEEYNRCLAKLAALLSTTEKPLTAKQIATKLRVTRATAANRIEALSVTTALQVSKVRAGKRGPWSDAFRVVTP